MTDRVNATPTPEQAPSDGPTSLGTRWQRVDGSLVRRTPRSIVISVPAVTAPLRIEGAAAHVWDALASPRGLDEVVAALASEAGSTDDLAGDTARALQALA